LSLAEHAGYSEAPGAANLAGGGLCVTYEPAARTIDASLSAQLVSRIWRRDVTVWTSDPAGSEATAIANRLGWLDVPTGMGPELTRVRAHADEVRGDGLSHIYLLGMGGSSLCAEVIRSVYGGGDRSCELVVMDTTDETTIGRVVDRLDPRRALFIVASKSGGTIEPAALEKFYGAEMTRALGTDAGRHFVAITDPGTALATLARDRRYRETFLNPPDIGGRFSALSLFGLVPGALLGVPIGDMLSAAADMAQGCRQENHQNAGLTLGAFFGTAAREGRDKLTVVLPRSLSALGLWIEQLVAESTGKHGKGALPIVDEPLGVPDEYSADRCFVSVATDHDAPDAARLDALEHAGHPVLRLSTRVAALGAEFFRWEFATAVAGAVLGINPFDEPNVQEAKDKTREILSRSAFDPGAPTAASGPVGVYSRFGGTRPSAVVRAALESLRPHDYAAFLSYLPAEPGTESAVAAIRQSIRARKRVATTFGVGPRYLHSTGQYHKGGPNSIVAFVITNDETRETPIPDAPYSFAQLKRAQALGDVRALGAHERRTVHIHLQRGADPAPTLRALFHAALR
jgi:glucose-6-phosphate isomerase